MNNRNTVIKGSMQTFYEAIAEGEWENKEGYLSKLVGNIEICLEPLLFDKQFYLACYVDKQLLFPKVPMKVGK